MKGKNVGRTHNRYRRSNVCGLSARSLAVPKLVTDGGGDEGIREDEIDGSKLAVVCDSLPLPWVMETTTSKESLDVIRNCRC